jgi:outer membrane protein OmpA-like peptidoglycan-associated protein
MRAIHMLLLLGTLVAVPQPAQAQFLKRVKEQIKSNVAARKQRTVDNAVARAAEPADSALEKMMSPVDSAAARAGGKAGKAVAGIGRGAAAVEEERIREQLAGGRADLVSVIFAPGTADISPSSEPTVTALANVLAGSPQAFVILARGDPGGDPSTARQLGDARAGILKAWLLQHGVPAERLFAAGDAAADPGAAAASVVAMQ